MQNKETLEAVETSFEHLNQYSSAQNYAEIVPHAPTLQAAA